MGPVGGTLCCDFKNNSPGTFDRLPPMNGPGVRYAGLPATLGGTAVVPPMLAAAAAATKPAPTGDRRDRGEQPNP